LNELTGINLAMPTPMDADGSIDYARWEELIDLYIDGIPNGTLTEFTPSWQPKIQNRYVLDTV